MASQFEGYGEVKVGNIPPSKLKKALQGKAIRLTKGELIGDRVMVVHKLNKKAIEKAQKKGAGLTTNFSTGEAMADLNHYNKMGGALAGGSLWSWLKNAASSVGKWLKDSGVGTALADAAVPFASSVVGPAGATAARALLKQTTGVGMKGSPEMKAKMAAIRSKRKTGGSFMIN
jgi:hypothetical protein